MMAVMVIDLTGVNISVVPSPSAHLRGWTFEALVGGSANVLFA